MPKVEVYRPNRSAPRPFTVRDVARLYCRVVDQGTPREIIDAAIELECPDEEERQDIPVEELLGGRERGQFLFYSRNIVDEMQRSLLEIISNTDDQQRFLLGMLAALGILLAVLRPIRAVLRRTPGASVVLAGIERQVIATERQIEQLARTRKLAEDTHVNLSRALTELTELPGL